MKVTFKTKQNVKSCLLSNFSGFIFCALILNVSALKSGIQTVLKNFSMRDL